MQRSLRELTLLNEVATALGAAQDLEAILRRIVRAGIGAVEASQGTITLVDAERSDENHTAVRTSVRSSEGQAFRPSDVLLGWMHWYKKPLRIDDPHADDRFNSGDWSPEIRSVLSVPLLIRSTLVGVLTVFNKRGGTAFSPEDERLLAILAAQSAQVVENARVREEHDRVRRVFGQHTAPAVVDELLGAAADLVPRRQRVCVLALAVRDFAAFAEQAEPEAVLDRLNGLLWFMIDVVNRHHGIVHRLRGDGFLALFGAPVAREHDARDAVATAREIVERLGAAVASEAVPPTSVGIGLHTGEVVAGLVGSQVHREYQITGDVPHVASQLAALDVGGSSAVLASAAVRDALDGETPAEPLGPVELDGREDALAVYRLA